MRKTLFWMRFVFLFLPLGVCLAVPVWPMARKPSQETPERRPPLTLGEAYRLSLRQSETIAIKGTDIERTWADFFHATSEALGTVNFQITDFFQEPQNSGTSSDGNVGSTFTSSERRERTFVIHQPLFQGFKAIAALRGAGDLRGQRIYEKTRAEQLLFQDVVTSFDSVLRDQTNIEIYKAMIALFKDRIADLVRREQIGKSRQSEIASAEARMKTEEANLARANGTLAVDKRVLEYLTGTSLENRQLAEETQPQKKMLELGEYLESAKTRPDVEAAQQAVGVTTQQVVVAQSKLWPTLSLDNNYYEKREGFQSGIDWDLLFTLDVPLFQGGEAIGDIKEAVSNRKKYKLLHAQAIRQAELEIKRAYDAWKSSIEESKALEEAVRANEKNYELQKQDYSTNLVSNLDVLAAMESLNQARLETSRSSYEEKVHYWQLQIATGACCESFGSID